MYGWLTVRRRSEKHEFFINRHVLFLDEIEVIICGGDAQITSMMAGNRLPKPLRTIVVIEALPEERVAELRKTGLQIFTMRDVEVNF